MIQEGGEEKAYKVKKLRWRQAGLLCEGGQGKESSGKEAAEISAGCQQNGATGEILTGLDQQTVEDCSRTEKKNFRIKSNAFTIKCDLQQGDSAQSAINNTKEQL